MKISIESANRIKMIPENDHEKDSLDALWKMVIRCESDSKVLCPIGAYIASEHDGASFALELDWTCLCWGVDLRFIDGRWEC